MLYQLLKPIVTIAVRIYYKRVQIRNEHWLNTPGPTLIVANHSNAFLDAITIEIFAKQALYAMARGDAFKSPLANTVLTSLHVIPIYRKGETDEIMEKNEQAFETCMLLLQNNQKVIMFPEGDCITEKRLRKLKKGAARIALRTEAHNQFNLGLKVLPVGLNFSAARNFRSKLFINVGEPVEVKDFASQYAHDPVKTINGFTQHLDGRMRKLIIDIEHHHNDQLYEDLVAFSAAEHRERLLADDFSANQRMVKTLNFLQNNNPGRLKALGQQLRHYHETLDRLRVTAKLFTLQTIAEQGFVSSAKNIFLVGLGMPLHLIGIALNYLPYRLAYSNAGKVKQAQFYASVNFAIGMFGWIAYYLIQLLIIALLSGKAWVTAAFAALIPLTGLYSLAFYSFMKNAFSRWRLFSLQQNHPEVVGKLLIVRKELQEEIRLLFDQE